MKKIIITVLATLGIIAGIATIAATKIYITGYDKNNNPVKVEKGVYSPGISLTPVKQKVNNALLGTGMIQYKEIVPLNGIVASTTSESINIRGAQKVTLDFTHNPWINGGATSTFKFLASVDGNNFTAFSQMVPLISNPATTTRVDTFTLSATTTDYQLSLDLFYNAFDSFKIVDTMAIASGTFSSGFPINFINLGLASDTIRAFVQY